MLVHVEVPRTEKLEIRGEKIPSKILKFLKENYTVRIFDKKEEEELLLAKEMDWYKETKEGMTPASTLKTLRETRSMTQKQLGEAIGVHPVRISEYERGVRAISKEVAKKIAKELRTSVEHFI